MRFSFADYCIHPILAAAGHRRLRFRKFDAELDSMAGEIYYHIVKQLPGTDYLTYGSSGTLYIYRDRPEVVKIATTSPRSLANIEIEKRVYERLGTSHPNIIHCLRIEDYGIHLEWAEHGSIREYFRNNGVATLEERIQWCRDVADALQFVHEKNIKHADLGGRNVLLDSSRTIRLCDFAGSAIDGNKATVWAESGFRHPDDDEMEFPTIAAELHALGSTILEIMTSLKPWEKEEEHEWMVAKRIREGNYPDVTGLVLGNTITRCWKGEFQSAREVVQAIDSLRGCGTA